MCGATAMTTEALSKLRPTMVINVTSELPILPVTSVTSVRVDIMDCENQDLLSHLHLVTSIIRLVILP